MTTDDDRIEAAWQEHLQRKWAEIAEWAVDMSFDEFADWYAETSSGRTDRGLIEAREHFREIAGPILDRLTSVLDWMAARLRGGNP